jgi:hypothetical protein
MENSGIFVFVTVQKNSVPLSDDHTCYEMYAVESLLGLSPKIETFKPCHINMNTHMHTYLLFRHQIQKSQITHKECTHTHTHLLLRPDTLPQTRTQTKKARAHTHIYTRTFSSGTNTVIETVKSHMVRHGVGRTSHACVTGSKTTVSFSADICKHPQDLRIKAAAYQVCYTYTQSRLHFP